MHFIRRVAALCVAISLVFSPLRSYAGNSEFEAMPQTSASSVLGKVSGVWTLDMWHYSGGYWRVGNKGGEQIKVMDEDINKFDEYLEANHVAVFDLRIPESIGELLVSGVRGRDWEVEFGSYRYADCSTLFAESAPQDLSVKSATEISFSATPKFHFNGLGESLKNYCPGMSVTVPLIDRKYGCNIYSVFGNGKSAVQGLGYYDETAPDDKGRNAIHPSMIKDATGALEPGHPITLGVNVVDSEGYGIGSGTFAAAGACGLHFEFPVSLVFKDLRVPDPPEDPPAPPGEGAQPGTPEEPDPPAETEPAGPAADSLTALLDLPARTYAGHEVRAEDISVYEIDGELCGAARAAEIGAGKSSFSIVQKNAGTVRKSGKTAALIVFDRPGNFDVRLTASARGGLTDEDVKSIEVLRTPCIIEDIGGTQKENRKQRLLAAVAQDPENPVDSMTLRLWDRESGEGITVIKNFGAEEYAPANTEHIKYRRLINTGEDSRFFSVELDFLTKWHDERTLAYEIEVSDAAGGRDLAAGEFSVAPDMPPLCGIDLKDAYYREKTGGAANVDVRDASCSDGDALERAWYMRLPGRSEWMKASEMQGFKDLSFGSGREVSIPKNGVGKFDVRLTVRDVWTEETLEEYVSEADRLQASAVASSHVDNIAPRVSLETLRTDTAEILLLAQSEELRDRMLREASGIKAALLSGGISAELGIELIRALPSSQTGELKEVLSKGSGGARDLRGSADSQIYFDYFSGMWAGGNVTADEANAYVLTGTVQAYGPDPSRSVDTYPYTVRAYGADGNVLWSSSLTRSMLPSESFLRDARWGHDTSGTYLYLSEGGKTALFDKKTGVYAATLPAALSGLQMLTDSHIYAFKEDGIYRMGRSGGPLVCVCRIPLSCPALLGGSVHFTAKADAGGGLGLYRCEFDPEGERLSYTLLEGSTGGYARDAEVVFMDAFGAVCARTENRFYCWDRDGLLIKSGELERMDGEGRIFPIWSGNGRVEYLGHTGTVSGGQSRHTLACAYGIYEDAFFEDSESSTCDYPSDGKALVFGVRDKNGAIGIYLGGSYLYATGERYKEPVYFSLNGSTASPFSFPMETGIQNFRWIGATANTGGNRDIKQLVRAEESPDDEEARLRARNISGKKDFSFAARLSEEIGAESVVSELSELKRAGRSASFMRKAGGGTAEKKVPLIPGAEYFYEYCTTADSDVLSVEADISGIPGAEGFSVEGDFSENFDDSDTCAFFSFDAAGMSGGRYRLAVLRTSEKRYAAIQSGSEKPVKFTVPEGFRAVLMFDYEAVCASGANSSYAVLSEEGAAGGSERLDAPALCEPRPVGTCMHVRLLDPGSYSLGACVRDYTKYSGRLSAFYLDDLRVMLVKEGRCPALDASVSTVSSVSGEGEMRRVSGSFTAPSDMVHFAPCALERFSGTDGPMASLSDGRSGNSRTLCQTVSVPEGRTAVYALFEGSGEGGEYETSSGKKRYDDVSWSLGEENIGVHSKSQDGRIPLLRLGDTFRLSLRNFTGVKEIRASWIERCGTRASAEGLSIYVSEAGADMPQEILSGRFFEEGGRLYALNAGFSGRAHIRLSLPEGAAIRDFKLYSAFGGGRSYAADCPFRSESDFASWEAEGLAAEAIGPGSETPARVYAKGEAINYSVFYDDPESDPSKARHWVYAHEPMNDGPYPDAGKDLGAPVPRFWTDGKYTVTHWQEDGTGDASYDKGSGKVSLSFYVRGGGSGRAPRVTYIKTDPREPLQGTAYAVHAGIDDPDKDTLSALIEVYRNAESRPVASRSFTGLKPDALGRYPELSLGAADGLPAAQPGVYDVVVSVRDDSAAGVDSLRFRVKDERSISASVSHTAEWERNRLLWNEAKRGTGAVRAANVFWPGEALVLESVCAGGPVRVEARIKEFPQYSARLKAAGAAEGGKAVFEGKLWDASMTYTIGTEASVLCVVRFTAHYADGAVLSCDVPVVFDQSEGAYHRLHRSY